MSTAELSPAIERCEPAVVDRSGDTADRRKLDRSADTSRPRGVAVAATVRAESIAGGVVSLLVLMVVQRLVGFARSILFCRWLDPQELGQWDVAFGFLMLAAPLAVLGLPGSFGRYFEHYRQRGLLRTFLKRTTVLSAALSLVALALIGSALPWFSVQIFGRAGDEDLVVWLALSLATVIAHNFLTSLFIAARQYRVVSGLQFFQTVLFAAFGVVLVLAWQTSAASLVIAYGAASLVSSLGCWPWIKGLWAEAGAPAVVLPQRRFWLRLLPFAAWFWVTNLLSNLFGVIDRYMIVHYSGWSEAEALAQVGHYHSARIVPLLFVSVAMLLSSMITPHLSADWEAGRRRAVSDRLNLVLKLLGLALLGGSVVMLWTAPLLFGVALQGKFSGGLEILPWTLVSCAWFGLGAVAQNYLWCAEKAGLGSLGLLFGLALNAVLNLLWLPAFGLQGAAWATSAANLLALTLFFVFSHRQGMRVDRGTWLICLSPAVLGLGVWPATALLVGLLAAGSNAGWLFSSQEISQFRTAYQHLARRLGFNFRISEGA